MVNVLIMNDSLIIYNLTATWPEVTVHQLIKWCCVAATIVGCGWREGWLDGKDGKADVL